MLPVIAASEMIRPRCDKSVRITFTNDDLPLPCDPARHGPTRPSRLLQRPSVYPLHWSGLTNDGNVKPIIAAVELGDVASEVRQLQLEALLHVRASRPRDVARHLLTRHIPV
jgi:hypothetical protein